MKIKYLHTLLFLWTFSSIALQAQCDANNFAVTTTPGTCPADGNISILLPGGPPCSGWQTILTNPGGVETIQNIPSDGGPVSFSDLAAGDYAIRLVNGSTIIQYPNNPVRVTTSYQTMDISSTTQAPSCPTTANFFSPDGTLEISINSGGTGPFIFEVNSNFGPQSSGSTFDTSWTFGNMQGGETVSFTVIDTGCGVSQTQNPGIDVNNNPDSFFLGSVFRRGCVPNCNTYEAAFQTIVFTQERIDAVQLPGNATISINGGPQQDLTFSNIDNVVSAVVFTYPPGLGENDAYEVNFNDGCSTFGYSSTTLPIANDLLDIVTTLENDPNTCDARHSVSVSSRIRRDAETYQMFCSTNNIVIEQETAPNVWVNLPLSNTISNPLNLADLPSAYELPNMGRYRIIATDDCHTITKEFDTVDETDPLTSPLSGFGIGFSPSILEGTGAMALTRITEPNIANSFTPIPNTTYQISPVPFVPSIDINPTQPYSLGVPYTINFPVSFTTTTNTVVIGDLPPGEYEIVATDVCGNTATKSYTVQQTATYAPNIQALSGCANSGRIIYDLGVTNVARFLFPGVEVELWTDDGNGALGTLIEGDILPDGYTGSFENLSEGDYLLRFTGINFDSPIDDVTFSAVTLSNSDREYTIPVTIEPYEQIQSNATGAFCDLNDTSSGIVLVEIVDGTPTFPIVYELFSSTDLSNPVQTFTQTDISATEHLFQNVQAGNYVISVITPCDSQDIALDLIPAPIVATTTADTTLCPGDSIELSIDLPASLFDIVWTDDQGNTVGTGADITTLVTAPTTFTATYAFNPLFCSSPIVNMDTVQVDFYPELTQTGPESTTCNVSGADYTLTVELSETAPFTVNGTGSPGVFNGNVWTSDPIPAGIDYNVSFQDTNNCSSLTISDVAPNCCVFQVTCPTFPPMTVECYADLPSASILTETEFETLGNADGIIGNFACGIIEITTANSPDMGSCGTTITRTYTVTEYEDTNANGVRDRGENTVLNSLECVQNIMVNDTTLPTFVETLPNDATLSCEETIPNAPILTAVDNCDPNVQVTFDETITNSSNCTIGYTITRTWTATDCTGNSSIHTQVMTIPPAEPIMADFDEEITIICGEEIPPVPNLILTGGCGDYVVSFTEEILLLGSTDDFVIERLWEVTDSCGNVELFQQIINVVQPDREIVTIDICVEDDNIDLIRYLPSSFDTNGTFEIVSGNGTLSVSIFDPSDFGVGEHQISYSSTEGTCKYFVDFTVRINADCVPCNALEILASKTVTANSDGINDFFEVKGGEYCDYVFGLQIINRWGQIVYETDNYENNWSGFSPNNAFGSSRTLPSGTYYYIITVRNHEVEPINGFIYLGSD